MEVEVVKEGNSRIYWTAKHQGKVWLTAAICTLNWNVLETNDEVAALFLRDLLEGINNRKPAAFQDGSDYHFTTNLQFPANYGLGSSSTLINNLAEWSGADAYELNTSFLKGSGYDIAVAQKKSPVLFRNHPKIEVQTVDFAPSFKDQLVFIHLNQKQDSREGISLYRSKKKSAELTEQFSLLTMQILHCNSLHKFSDLIESHERELSQFLELPTVKEKLFEDYAGAVKSLGAWGGDFVMAVKTEGWQKYFSTKNYTGIYEWDGLILSNSEL